MLKIMYLTGSSLSTVRQNVDTDDSFFPSPKLLVNGTGIQQHWQSICPTQCLCVQGGITHSAAKVARQSRLGSAVPAPAQCKAPARTPAPLPRARVKLRSQRCQPCQDCCPLAPTQSDVAPGPGHHHAVWRAQATKPTQAGDSATSANIKVLQILIFGPCFPSQSPVLTSTAHT